MKAEVFGETLGFFASIVALPDLYFYWSLYLVAAIVLSEIKKIRRIKKKPLDVLYVYIFLTRETFQPSVINFFLKNGSIQRELEIYTFTGLD